MKDCFYLKSPTGRKVCKYFWDYPNEGTYIQPPTVGCDVLQIDPSPVDGNDFLNIKGIRIMDGPEAMFTRDFHLIIGEGWKKFYITSDSHVYPPIVFIRGIELPTSLEKFYIQGSLPLDYLILNCPKINIMNAQSISGLPNLKTLNMTCIGPGNNKIVEYTKQAIIDIPRLKTLIFPRRAKTYPQAVSLVGINTDSGCDITFDSATLGTNTFSQCKINRLTLKGATYDFDPPMTSIGAGTTVKELCLCGDLIENLLNQEKTGVRLRFPPPDSIGLKKIIIVRDKFSRGMSTADFTKALDLIGYSSHFDLVEFEPEFKSTTE